VSFKVGDLVVLISKKRSTTTKAGKHIFHKQPGLLIEKVTIPDTRSWTRQMNDRDNPVPGPGWMVATADGVVRRQEKGLRLQDATPEYIANMMNAHLVLGRKIEEWKIANLATL
tara:strand:+ start:1000 stop:1341 length:342 start_codon:yes stop_codon:yes gene_type:complete